MASESASRTIVVATGNAHKVDEIASALDFAGWRFVAAGRMEGGWREPVEDGETFEDNARIKARAAHERFGVAALADDSGLEVDALGGAPGVHSSRFAGEEATDADNNELLLDRLSSFAPGERAARFRSTLVFIDEQGVETVVSGTCEGSMGSEARGVNGFGYDPLFLPILTPGCTMAELSMAEKNAISHRGDALRALKAALALASIATSE
jgi:XTP/dITP diphosphohydrolase